MLPPAPPGETWIGDDAAVVPVRGTQVLLTTDVTVEGVHADLGLVRLSDFGWRAVATAVSDTAAMGGCADRLLVSVAGPPDTDLGLLYQGIVEAASDLGAAVVGGDLSSAEHLVVAVTVVGHVPEGAFPVLRSGAMPGDKLIVTGLLGAAAAGLRLLRAEAGSKGPLGPAGLEGSAGPAGNARLAEAHRRPVARLEEGRIARIAGATAMIDISDGIASDARRIAVASGVGMRFDTVPVAKGATEREALCGGDDYELLFAAPDVQRVVREFESAGLREPYVVGQCTADPSELTLRGEPLADCGYEHPWRIPTRVPRPPVPDHGGPSAR
jgi:thiamine-monophosphate kinase